MNNVIKHEMVINKEFIVIPWSGGVDSTAIIFQLIDFASSEKGMELFKDVNIFLISGVNITTNSGRAEYSARLEILETIQREYSFFYKRLHVREIMHDTRGYGFNVTDGTQSFFWLNMVHSNFGSNYSTLFGYIVGDQFWDKINEFNAVIDANNSYYRDEYNRDIHYPLESYTKAQVYNMLPDNVKCLVKFCSDMNDDGSNCMKCPSCIVHYEDIVL